MYVFAGLHDFLGYLCHRIYIMLFINETLERMREISVLVSALRKSI